MELLKETVSFALSALHILLIFYALFAPYVTNNTTILLLTMIYYMFIMTQWYLMDGCILTPIEDYLMNKKSEKYADGSNKSFITVFFNSVGINENIMYFFWVFVTVFNFLVCAYKIYSQTQLYKNCRKSK